MQGRRCGSDLPWRDGSGVGWRWLRMDCHWTGSAAS